MCDIIIDHLYSIWLYIINTFVIQTPIMAAELQPADVEKMIKAAPSFEGLRLEGENVYRGQGNFKVSRYIVSLFSVLMQYYFCASYSSITITNFKFFPM